MANRLPEKLIALRKNFSYSQQDVAKMMGVPVNEYMKWENGSKLCAISQLIKLANIFNIPVDELFNNTLDVEFINNSIDIPFQDILKNDSIDSSLFTKTISSNEIEVVENEKTIAISKPIVDEKPKEEKPKLEKKKSNRKRNKYIYIGLSAGIVCVLAFLGFFILKDKNKYMNTLSNTNRFIAKKDFALYLNKDGTIKKFGNYDLDDYKNIVQISYGADKLYVLNKDGSVTCSKGPCGSEDWKNIKQISASPNSILGLSSDKSVKCTGNGCDVKDWKDIDYVYASSLNNYGISNNKLINSSSISDIDNIVDMVSNQNYFAYILKDKTVRVVPLRSSKPLDVEEWTNITSIKLSNDFIVGLRSDGSLLVSDEEVFKEVENWKNIQYIDVFDDQIVGIDDKLVVFGTKDVSYSTGVVEIKEEEEVKLDNVKNIKFSESGSVLSIIWDKVENANYYEVVFSKPESFKIRTEINNITIEPIKLKPDTDYEISVIAYSNNADILPSESNSTSYHYVGKSSKQYIVSFYDYDGKTLLKEESVDENANATPPNNPVREGYVFDGWDGNYNNIVKDTKIIAKYKPITVNIIFRELDDTILTQKEYEINADIIEPLPSTKQNAVFDHWDNNYTGKATRDAVYKPVYACTISFEDGKIILPDSMGNCYCPESYTLENNVCKK